jgi:hypothetical protein
MSTESGGKPPVEERIVRPSQFIPWVAVVGTLITGVIGIGGAIRALGASVAPPHDGAYYIGAGACLAAAALAFGLLSNAIFRR